MKEFITRTTTAFFLISFAYFSIEYLPDLYFSILLFMIISVGVYEFLELTKPSVVSISIIYLNGLLVAFAFTFGKISPVEVIYISIFSFGLFFLFSIREKEKLETFIKDYGIHMLTITYLFIPLYFIFLLRKIGPNYLFFLLFVIAVGDTGAYFIGRLIGKHKIYPVASPKKSLEGIISAVVTAGITGWISIYVFPIKINMKIAIVTAALTGLISQLSDPVESLFKRASGKKDSGSILPGHGGVLDRVDSYIFCAPFLYFVIKYIWM